MTTTRAQEIAESFINGNISWVKERTKTKKAFLAVLEALTEMGQDTESFKRICG